MAQSAVLVGRTMADLVRNVFVILLMAGVGYAVGFRVQTNVFMFLGGIGLLMLLVATPSPGGSRRSGSARAERRDRAADGVPDPDAAHVRVVGVRPRRVDAGLAPGVGEQPAGERRRSTPRAR